MTATPVRDAARVCFFIASTFSAWLRCRFLWVNASDAVSAIEPVMVSLSRNASARLSPLRVEPQRRVVRRRPWR